VVVRDDPEGVWVEHVFRFPGTGTDYPLASGSVALIARSAIDHRFAHAALFDLTQADFEWGSNGVDNPDVPNLEDIGLRPMMFHWPMLGYPQFLSEPADLQNLPQYVDPISGNTWARIPRELILDVWAAALVLDATSYQTWPPCTTVAHRYFERLPGPPGIGLEIYDGVSFQRRVLTVLPDGRTVLQDTNTSMVDFVKAARTPGWVPDSLL
jgi:hypothetical protein